jgi:hypothetical protein
MKSMNLVLSLLFVFFGSSLAATLENGPVAVSPASEVGIAIVTELCPTFSWTAVKGAEVYRVEVFPALDGANISYAEMSVLDRPVLIKEIRGTATSWTPGADDCLSNGGRYSWYVQAIDALGNGRWSRGASFEVKFSKWSSELDGIVADALEEIGVGSELIPDVLKHLRSRAEEATLKNSEPHGSTYIPPMFSIQSTENQGYTYLGYLAGSSCIGITNTTLFGSYAGWQNTTGGYNVFIGHAAGFSNTTGGLNNFMGYYSGYANTTGDNNTFLGHGAGRWNTVGEDNTFIGLQAGYNSTGTGNLFLGRNAGIGFSSGDNNTCVGIRSASTACTDSGNVFLGYRSGFYETGTSLLYIDNSDTTAPLIWGDFENDIVSFMGTIGVNTKTPGLPMEMKKTGANASIVVDRTDGATNYINATATFGNFGTVNSFPLRLVVNAIWRMRLNTDNSLQMKNGASCTAAGVWTNASSRDLKENIRSISTEEAVEALGSLDPVKYNYKTDQQDEYVGFIAEDVPELVASKDRKGMSSMDVVAVLTKVVQEQYYPIGVHK